MRKTEEAKAKQDELIKQDQRKKTYDEAQRREGERVSAILERQHLKDQALEDLGKKREHEADLKSLKHQLELENKRDKAEPQTATKLYLVQLSCMSGFPNQAWRISASQIDCKAAAEVWNT